MAIAVSMGNVQADSVTQWNAIMQSTVGAAPTNANFQARWGAIVQLAVFEAVNAISTEYAPYLGIIEAPSWASMDAAVATAAHRTLITLRPAQAATLNAALDASLAVIQEDPEAIVAGIIVGENAAAAMLELRADDGASQAGSVPYTPGNQPGDWQPAPPTFAAASLPGWGQVMPFGLEEGSQFRLPPPPALRSGRYAADYQEVQRVGKLDSPHRPQDRTDVARFYASASPIQVWNQAARQVSADQELTLTENAQLFALVAMVICDASIAAYESKYHYNFWRPLTAIRAGDSDGNHKTVADIGWLPLLATPSFPSYGSAHATLSNAASTVLERAVGKDGHEITLTNPSLPAIILHYTAWGQITDDIDDARVYGGIHFRFEQKFGALQGRHVANYILEYYLRPLEELAAGQSEPGRDSREEQLDFHR